MKLLTTLFIALSLVSCQVEEAEFFEKEIFEGIQEDNLEDYADNYEDADIDPIEKDDLIDQSNGDQQQASNDSQEDSDEEDSSQEDASQDQQLASNDSQEVADEQESSEEDSSQDQQQQQGPYLGGGSYSQSESQQSEAQDEQSESEEQSQEEQIADAPNLIINGSFEEGHNLGKNKWNVFASLPGWELNREYADAPLEIQNGPRIGGISPTDGSAKLELDSHAKKGFTESDASIYQENIPTMAGGLYELSIDYSPRNANRKESNSVEILFDGQVVAKLMEDKRGFKTYKFEVNALNSGSRLELRAGKDNDTLGAYLDNISLKLISEPVVALPFTLKIDDKYGIIRSGNFGDRGSLDFKVNGVRKMSIAIGSRMRFRPPYASRGSEISACLYQGRELASNCIVYKVGQELDEVYDGPVKNYPDVELNEQYLSHDLDFDGLDLLSRSGRLGENLTWKVELDGMIVLERNASNELDFPLEMYAGKLNQGRLKIWLVKYIDGWYQPVSEMVEI